MITVFGSKTGQQEINEVSESLKNQWLGMGPKVQAFENGFKKHGNLEHFLMVDSGSNALFLAVSLLDLPPQSEIILPSFTWVSCAQAVLLAGHKPVLCDVDLDTMNVTAKTIKPHITDKTKAIMVVHYAGLPVEMDEILALGFPVIEDAAHAVDSFYKGAICGSVGEVGIYSFDAVKNLAVGEGGGITTKDANKAKRAKLLRYCGIGKSGFEASSHGKQRWWEYDITEAFIKMNPSDIAGGIGIGQLANLPENQQRRKDIWELYQQAFGEMDWIVTPKEAPEHSTHSYFTYSIRLTGKHENDRDRLAHYLLEKGIYSTLRYHPLHLNPIYAQMNKDLPNCAILNETSLSIPLHPNMTLEDAHTVINVMKDFG